MNASISSAKFEDLFIMRPLSFFKPGVTRSASKIRALLYSYSMMNERFDGGYAAIRDAVRTSRASIWRAVSKEKLPKDFELERHGGENGKYTYVGEHNGKGFHIRTELWFYGEKFDVDGAERLLTDAEIDVLSLIYTFTKHEKTGKFEGNYSDIARMLGLDYYTVRRTVKALFSAELIFRPKKSANHHKKSVYKANLDLIRRLDNAYKKKHKQAQDKQCGAKTQSRKVSVRNLNDKTDRERFYAERREEAQQIADANTAKANAIPGFRELAADLSVMEIKLAKAEIYAPIALPALKAEKADLKAKRADFVFIADRRLFIKKRLL